MSIVPWFWFLGNQRKDNEESGLSDIERWKRKIRKNSNEDINELIGNFSWEGFNEIFICLIQKTQRDMNIFINNFDTFFTDEMFYYFKHVLSEYESKDIKVFLSTYDSEKDKRLLDLDDQFKCFTYIPVSCKNADELNNFIVVDCKSWWIEDLFSIYTRKIAKENGNTKYSFIKASVNFNDPLEASKLLMTMDKIKALKHND